MSIEKFPSQNEEIKTKLSWEQKEILKHFKKAKRSEERVKLFAKFADEYGIDTLLGLFEGVGDLSSSALAGIYLMFEANQTNLRKTDFLKIIALQTTDFAIGSVPIIWIVGDHFFKANKISSKYFVKNTNEIKVKAKELGITDQEIAQVEKSAMELPKLLTFPVQYFKNDTEMQMAA